MTLVDFILTEFILNKKSNYNILAIKHYTNFFLSYLLLYFSLFY